MNQIKANLSVENILLNVQASSKKRAFEQVAQIFEDQYGIARATVFDSLFARERLGSTALGHGVAIPHGRIPKLEETHIAVLRLETPIAFDAPDSENVRLLFCLLVPESATQEHLDLLATIAKKLSNEETRKNLFSVESPEEIYNILTQDESDA
ncbi:PTS IIA-like nitrogen regulatory protein PtsN [Taylorella equigenitalis]|uniref:PTS IIA-like nitrogen regulatory protein PtsN n=1 Tax=Taylorella equigenitalis TaxID=29575 RepID=UPI00247833C9|nr:PTS IIA-like nitrogen regulatory protein PtsN [Taylorella equigenitalis]WGQ29823.1 PTS IIA-like nitrogen regulatory protein PtsN [Taylorella equigenitalis]